MKNVTAWQNHTVPLGHLNADGGSGKLARDGV